jgi:hypothetical protein
VFTSGSTKFGDTLDDNHEITGSLLLTGSLGINDNTPGYALDVFEDDQDTIARFKSGDTLARIIIDDGNDAVYVGTRNGINFFGPDASSTGDNNLLLDASGNITAKGNISASGDVKGLTLTTPGNITGSTIEGQILLADLNITSSGNISASGNIIANSGSFNYIESINRVRHTNDGGTEISFVNDTVIIRANSRETFRGGGNFTRLGNDDTPTRISGSSIMFNSPINSTSNITTTLSIIATGNISSNGTGSFNGGLVLTSPNGDQFVFTVNNSGHLSLTGSAV